MLAEFKGWELRMAEACLHPYADRLYCMAEREYESMSDKRLGVIGIVIEDRASAEEVNQILSQHADMIVGRMGIPYREKEVNVIALIVDGTTDQLGSLTGRLGTVPQVTVKSALTKRR
ncbi:MAG: TM1266 family iron-only hydrogenase system putative regulator [Syntrophomonadaceae bacterium]